MPRSPMRLTWPIALAVALHGCGEDDDPGYDPTVEAGAIALGVRNAPWGMAFLDASGAPVLVEHGATGAGPTGSLGLFLGPPPAGAGQQPSLPALEDGFPPVPEAREDGWVRATSVAASSVEGGVYTATLRTTDPAHTLEVSVAPEADGVLRVEVAPTRPEGVQALGVAFVAQADERFVGFGERSQAVGQDGVVLEHYVSDGPYFDRAEWRLMEMILPPWGTRWRADASYFPIPWLLSSRGFGVLVDNDEISFHRVRSDDADAWSVEVEASQLVFRVFGGPTPGEALGRFTAAIGRQPRDYEPWFFGPWLDASPDARIADMRDADVPTSLSASYTHYLPCGSHVGGEEAQRARTAWNHAQGVAMHTYFNPMLCTSWDPVFDDAVASGALVRDREGEAYVYRYNTDLGVGFDVAQFDFSTAAGVDAYRALTDEALAHGYDGWMEDFGEYTPLDAVSADGVTGTAFHNRYVRDYHCGVQEATRDVGRPVARFARSGWTGSAACTPIVWGGDPTTGWGFDGLRSSVYRALSLGTSGVAIWGSDIGGFMSLLGRELDDELLDRWVAFGAMSVVMRTQHSGVRFPDYVRPQVWDEAHLPVWRRYAKLHTQLYPYLQAAAETYYDTGRPVMRHHVLTHPDDPRAVARDDQYLFGPDLLVAPVLEAGATERELHLPAGRWVEWWRSVAYGEAGGTFDLGAAVMHEGGASVTVAAPLDEIPLFVRAGAVIPMLAPDVFTLAEYGDDPAIVHASDRDGVLHVLAFPRGEGEGRFYDDGTWTSREGGGVWALTLDHGVERTVHLQATMRALDVPLEPCGVALDGAPLPEDDWSWDAATGVLDVTYTTTAGTLEVTGC